MKKLTQKRLKELVHYDQETGIFRAQLARPPWRKGKILGCNSHGYLIIKIDYAIYSAHRLAWLYVFGKWPTGHLDHKNCERSDNRIVNLREVTRSQNAMNSKLLRNNATGFKGVSKSGNRFRAKIGKCSLGTFESPEKAHAAYTNMVRKLFGDFANPG